MLKTLLRLLPLAIAGYALYRIYTTAPAPSQRRQPAMAQAGTFDATRLTGPGEGVQTVTGETAGTSVPHRVGRGVVRR